jgi:hypothetical protein
MSYFVVGQSWCDWSQRCWMYFSFVILKPICMFGFMLFMPQSFKSVSPVLYWDFSHVILCRRAVMMWLWSKKVSLFQFCDLKTNLHIRVHAFPSREVPNLFPLIFIEILAMSYFVVGQSWCDWGKRKLVYFSLVILKLICIFRLMLFHATNFQICFPWSLLIF